MKTSSKIVFAAAFVALTTGSMITAADAAPNRGNNSKFVVVDADRGRVVYDDGYNDGGCIFRRVFAGYDWYGYPRYRKVYRCF